MKIAVLTATCRYGGLDVTVASIKRQRRNDLVWIVADELYEQRKDFYDPHCRVVEANDDGTAYPITMPRCPIIAFDSSKLRHDDYPRTLSAANNEGLRIAREQDADMLVFLNDYVWAPPEGIDEFIQLAAEHPRSLLTGACSISDDPDVDSVVNREGLYTIFGEPYTRKPQRIGWRDCRFEVARGRKKISDMAWEGNWAAIPRELLHNSDLGFNEEYDRGHYYDNQAFSTQAFLLGFSTWIDCDNEAISLPHKQYFAEDQDALEAMNNRAFHEQQLREHGISQM